MALTKRAVDAFRYNPKGPARQILWDGDIPGFGVRVQPTGTKSFIVLYRVRTGRSRLLTLGRYGVLTVEQARKAARAELAEVAEGGDPVADRQAQRQAVRVAEFCDEYIERHAKVHKKTWAEDQRRIRTRIVPQWGTRALTDVKRPDVARLHGWIGAEKPYEANRVLALVAVMWGKAEEWGYLPDGHPNPARNIQPFREQERDRYVTPEELPRLLKAIEGDKDPFMRAAFLLYLLTGLRRSELLRLRWDQVDRASRLIRLPDPKQGRPHVVPLSEAALEVLASVPRLLGNPFVFASPKKPGAARVDLKRVWRRIRKRAELPDVHLHDLRRTVGSWLALGGESLPTIGKVLGHSNPSTTAVYARLAEDAGRHALERHAERVLGSRSAAADGA